MTEPNTETFPEQGNEFSVLVISLLKGVLYLENDPALWNALIQLQARVRDHIAVLGLELVLDEAEDVFLHDYNNSMGRLFSKADEGKAGMNGILNNNCAIHRRRSRCGSNCSREG